MPGGEPPKYLNSPEGPLFRKNEVLYGLDRARSAIATAGHAIVVEGYTDVLALHQSGTANAVASMGTALTEGQVTELKRVCSTVFLAFDSDAAGEEASLRGMALAEANGLSVRVVGLPPGKDPADVVLADPSAFARSIDAAAGVLSFRVARALGQGGTRDEIYARVAAIIGPAVPSVERDEQVRVVADRLRLTDDLAARLTAARSAGPVEAAPAAPARLPRSPWERDGRLFLGMALALPERGGELLGSWMWHTFRTSRCGKRPGTRVGSWPARGISRTRNGGRPSWLSSMPWRRVKHPRSRLWRSSTGSCICTGPKTS